MYGLYGQTLYGAAGGAAGETQVLELPLFGNVATLFPTDVQQNYPDFDPDDWPNEVQSVSVGGSGLVSFTLTFDGQTTVSLASNATAAQVYNALINLSNIEPDEVLVSGPAGGPWTIEFQNGLGHQDVPTITATPTGGSGTVTPVVVTPGVVPPAWWTPEAVPLGDATTYGIKVSQVTLPDAPGLPGTAVPILDAYDRSWQDALDADGMGSLTLDTTTAVPGLTVLRWTLNGRNAFQSVVDSIHEIEIAAGEEYDQHYVLEGRGAIGLLEDGGVHADFGIGNRPLADMRYFNYTAKTFPTTGWKPAVRTLPRYNTNNYYGRPKGMVAALIVPNGAEWLWDRPADVNVPGGDVYFRQWFTFDATKVTSVRVDGAADDEMQLWVDNVPILNIEGVYAGDMSYTVIDLSPGEHLVAWRGRNRNALRAGTIWSIATMDQHGNYKDTIATSKSSEALCLGYPTSAPGFTVGQAARQLIFEAQDRGEIPYITTSFLSFNDTDGTQWPLTSELSCRLDQSMLQVFRGWADTYWEIALGTADFRLHGWIKGQRGTDVLAEWRRYEELTELSRTMIASPTVAIVTYDGGRLEVEHPDVAILGRKVRALNLGHVKSHAQARLEGESFLAEEARRRETVALQLDIVDVMRQAYRGVWVGDSPLVAGERLRVHSFTVTEDEEGHAIVTPEVISSAMTGQERMASAAFKMNPGSGFGRSRAATPVDAPGFPSASRGSETEIGFSWEEVTGPVELLVFHDDGVGYDVVATLDPGPGQRAKTTLEPPVKVHELTKIVIRVGGKVSQDKRTTKGIWLMEFKVDRSPVAEGETESKRGTADLLIA